jgi:hypothetical protein
LLPSLGSQNWQQGGLRASANRRPRARCARPSRVRGAGVDVAGRRACSQSVLVRSSASVHRRAAPRCRPGRADGRRRTRSCRGPRLVRGHRSDRRQDGLDRDSLRLHRDARPSRLYRREARHACQRGGRRGDRRPERRRRTHRAVRLLRPPRNGAGPGLRRSAGLPSGEARRCGPDTAARGVRLRGGACRRAADGSASGAGRGRGDRPAPGLERRAPRR